MKTELECCRSLYYLDFEEKNVGTQFISVNIWLQPGVG